MKTLQRSEITPVEVRNPYCLKLRYTYSKCIECKTILPYSNFNDFATCIKKEKITTNQLIWDEFQFVICEECHILIFQVSGDFVKLNEVFEDTANQ